MQDIVGLLHAEGSCLDTIPRCFMLARATESKACSVLSLRWRERIEQPDGSRFPCCQAGCCHRGSVDSRGALRVRAMRRLKLRPDLASSGPRRHRVMLRQKRLWWSVKIRSTDPRGYGLRVIWLCLRANPMPSIDAKGGEVEMLPSRRLLRRLKIDCG